MHRTSSEDVTVSCAVGLVMVVMTLCYFGKEDEERWDLGRAAIQDGGPAENGMMRQIVNTRLSAVVFLDQRFGINTISKIRFREYQSVCRPYLREICRGLTVQPRFRRHNKSTQQ